MALDNHFLWDAFHQQCRLDLHCWQWIMRPICLGLSGHHYFWRQLPLCCWSSIYWLMDAVLSDVLFLGTLVWGSGTAVGCFLWCPGVHAGLDGVPVLPVSDAHSHFSCLYVVDLFSRRWMHLNALRYKDTILKKDTGRKKDSFMHE